MGAGKADSICAALLEAGRDPETPAAAIQQGSTREQRVAQATLRTLPQAMRLQKLTPPVVLVVGPVVELRGQLDWFRPEETTDTLVIEPNGE